MLPAVHVGTGILAGFLGWVANQWRLAAALEATDGVGAGGLGAAHVGVPLALVHVNAESPVRLKPLSTATRPVFSTLGVVGAVEVGLAARPNFGGEAAGAAVALVTGRTLAGVSGNPVDAFCSDAALVQCPGSAFVNILAAFKWVSSESLLADAGKAAVDGVLADGISATRVGFTSSGSSWWQPGCRAAYWAVGISGPAGGTLAAEAADLVGAPGPRAAGVGLTLVDVDTSVIRIALESLKALTGVISDLVEADSVGATDVWFQALVDISTFDLPVSFEAFLALADEMCWKIAAFCVGDTSARQLWIFTLVDVLTVVPVTAVAFSTGAEVAAQGVGAVGEHVAGAVLALVVVRHVAALAAVAVIAVALAVQAGAVLTLPACRVPTVVGAFELGVRFV